MYLQNPPCQVLNEQRANGQQHRRNCWTITQANTEPHRIQTVLKRQTKGNTVNDALGAVYMKTGKS